MRHLPPDYIFSNDSLSVDSKLDTVRRVIDPLDDERIDEILANPTESRQYFTFDGSSDYLSKDSFYSLTSPHTECRQGVFSVAGFMGIDGKTDIAIHDPINWQTLSIQAESSKAPIVATCDTDIRRLSSDELLDISLIASDIDPLTRLEMEDDSAISEQERNFNLGTLWGELAEKNEGESTSQNTIICPLPSIDASIRTHGICEQIWTEKPTSTEIQFVLSHVTDFVELDAIKVHRLILDYRSDGLKTGSVNGTSYTRSGRPRLIRAIAEQTNNGIRTKPLNVTDPYILQQFNTLLTYMATTVKPL